MDLAVALNRARAGRERLAEDLAAEDPLQRGGGLAAAEEPVLDLLEVEQGDELVDRLGHPPMLAATLGEGARGRRLAWPGAP